jgi:hypothetical protein
VFGGRHGLQQDQGRTDKIKGAVKEGVGKATGDDGWKPKAAWISRKAKLHRACRGNLAAIFPRRNHHDPTDE